MGFWHTGYMEFHEPVGIEGYVAEPGPPVFSCDQCHATFSSFQELRFHRFEQHPALRPVLFLRGHEVGSASLRLTRPLSSAEIDFSNAVAAEVNGQSTALTDLPNALVHSPPSIIDLRLLGDGTESSFRLRFELSTPEDIEGVERCFDNAAHRGRLDRRAIEDFIEAARPFHSAAAYCDGICDYLFGVLAKERHPDSTLKYSEYREKFNRAADTLRDIDRPLARVIESLVCFHFNHFAAACGYSPASRVGCVSDRMQRWILSQVAPPPPRFRAGTIDAAVTDLDTERLLTWACLPPNDLLSHEPELKAAIDRDIPEFDRAKLRLLLAESYRAAGRYPDASVHARELLNSSTFSRWAETILEPGGREPLND